MSKIPKQLLEDMLADPYYNKCARHDDKCAGRITFEHAIIYAGRQVQEKWAIIPLCSRHHSVNQWQDTGLLDKRRNEYIALSRMTPKDEAKYPRANWAQKKAYLTGLFGTPARSG